jgi:hypothetical protein
MRIKTGVQILGVALLLSGCAGVIPWSEEETVRVDVTGPTAEGNQREADARCAKYDSKRGILKESKTVPAPGGYPGMTARYDVFECVEPTAAKRRSW